MGNCGSLLSKTFDSQGRVLNGAVGWDTFVTTPGKEAVAFRDDVCPFREGTTSIFAGHQMVIDRLEGQFWQWRILGSVHPILHF